MKNKSIIIIITILLATILAFLGGVVLLRAGIDSIQAEDSYSTTKEEWENIDKQIKAANASSETSIYTGEYY